jgi:histidinol phosphatase-like PHP family hydrolase
VDVRAVAGESYGAALQYFTGSKQHNIHLRTLAQKKGLKINEYGVFRGEKRLGGVDEDEVYRLVGVPIMPPELREDRGEIEAALEGRLPKLIELADLRGDLHTHTNYSDGRASVEEMVEGAASLGYDYIALTDHSPSARIARGLDLDRLEEKIEEIERVRKQRGRRKPQILLGAEVDILADGRLDYPEEILARLDVVVAAVHSSFRQSRDRMTKRLLKAISNPYVHIIAHPLARLIGSREPVEFDFERIVEAAVEAGVALELNSQPLRLDLTDTMARAHSASSQVADDHGVDSVAQFSPVDALEFNPVEISGPGAVGRVEPFGDHPLQPALDLLVEKTLKLMRAIRHDALNQANPATRVGLDYPLERRAPRFVLFVRIILAIRVEQVESDERQRKFARHLFHAVFAFSLYGDLKRMEFAGRLVDGGGFSFNDRAVGLDLRPDGGDEIRKHRGRSFEVA